MPFALGWLVFISFLFCLPGSAIPKINWLSGIHFDKWVHIGLFAVLLFLWGNALGVFTRRKPLLLLLTAIAYGLLVEVVQDQLIVNRDFDLWDAAADTAGAMLGLWALARIKK
ncbi:hypothetical protein BUE76_04835 [Cnuella takakiae]|nr:hypothetical protein BUE76_04835 [Cnuella takakiae]